MEEVATMPSNNQEFCLRWNNFHNSLVTAIDGFKNDLDFVDVTISCEGQCLQAHKMLLSACSVLFRDLLKANPCQHPIVIMPTEVKFIDLEKMLRFIYQGEVNVQQENLARFLRTAEMLKIRGLAEDNEKQKVLRSSSPRPPEINEQASTSPKRPRLSSDHQTFNQEQPGTPNDDNSRLSGNDSDSEMLPVKQEMIENKDCDLDGSDEPYITDSYLKETSTASTPVCSQSSASNQQSTGGVPPPPGPLLPSYVPPPQIKPQDGLCRSSAHPVGGLIRRFLEECLQLPDPGPLLSCYVGHESTPHFQLLRSVAKEWSYCRNATQNYSSMGGSSKRQRATSRLIETFESIDALRGQLAQLLHQIIVLEVATSGIVGKVFEAEQTASQNNPQQYQHQQQADLGEDGGEASGSADASPPLLEVDGVSHAQMEHFIKSTETMKQLRKLYFDQSRRLAVRISQLKKGRQHAQERLQRQQQQLQQNYLQQTIQQIQQQQIQNSSQPNQAQHQMGADNIQLNQHGQISLHQLHQPWSD